MPILLPRSAGRVAKEPIDSQSAEAAHLKMSAPAPSCLPPESGMSLTRREWLLGMMALPAAGCVMIEVGVTNPIVGLTTVAIAPFFNVSQEPVVDGRQFALAYFAELQKTPGFQVVPVGITEQAIRQNRLEMDSPLDVLKLSELLHVDAVVVGAVTDYSPYYPPRVGLQVSWYSAKPWTFEPGPPVDPSARKAVLDAQKAERKALKESKKSGKSSFWPWSESETCEPVPPTTSGPAPLLSPEAQTRGQSPESQLSNDMSYAAPMPVSMPTFDPTRPLMSYTRLFDGADSRVVANLRDYVELSGDLRAGGWEAYLQRSDDFIRFTSYLMIVEMLQLHGGEARRRIVVKKRKYK
ncbi:hypothetical protein A6X21_16095 [Planctopirus hydrillae]|uniref:Uncharacterized protein n=1 Tax=Planctopirus hydrillae TaxID=1841610 RepID=A0A1C3ESV1_9PLAN|nr:hypothetical protein A6X21_16095 [Planctopirus hydrillae]